MKRKMNQAALYILAVQLLLPALAFSSENFEDKIMKVSPGMKREEAINILGKPDSILNKSLDQQGKLVEVWQYDPLKERNVSAGVGAMRSIGSILPIGLTPQAQMATNASLAQRRHQNPPYIIAIVDGVVQSINRGNA